MRLTTNKLSRLQLTGILFVTVIVLIIMGITYYFKEKELIENKNYNILESVGELKAEQISQWYKDRLAEATYYSSNLPVSLSHSGSDSNIVIDYPLLNTSLQKVMIDHRYENILMIDTNGRLLFSVMEFYQHDAGAVNIARQVLKTRSIVVNDFFYCNNHKKVHFDIASPVYINNHGNTTKSSIIAILVFRIDPHTYLYPLINTWPGDNKTAETVIGKGNGNKVVLLNKLIKQSPLPLELKSTDDNPGFPMIQAVNGISGRFMGKDYAGRTVLADLRHVPETPWSMVVKIDTSEVYGELYVKVTVVSLAIVLLVMALVVALTQVNNSLIKESERKFYSLFEKAPMAYQSLDFNGNIIEVNLAWCEMLGFRKEEITGKPFTDFLPKANIHLFAEAYDEFIRSGRYSSEFEMVRKDGEIVVVHHEGNVTYSSESRNARTHSILHDVTEKGRIISLLKENERRLASMVSHLPGFVYRCNNNPDWSILYISNGCKQVTGYEVDDFMIQFDSQYNELIVPEYRKQVYDISAEAITNGTFFETEYPILHKSGELRWVHERGKGVYDSNGELLFIEGYVEDISVSREAKNMLITAKEKAEESDRLKTAFLANMSHEIRTPMNGILGFLELLKEPDLDEVNKNEYLDLMNISGQRLLNTINDIIEISKIESGKLESKTSPVDMRQVFRFYTDFFKPEADLKNINLYIGQQIETDDAVILADKHKLDGILTNLVKNAIKFTKSGSIIINNALEGNELLLWIKDTGKGIPAHRLNAIFERFVQADTTYTRDHEGSGLGLAIVKAYADTLGGSVWVESEEGLGSTFFVRIPYVKAESNPATTVAADVQATPLHFDKTILVAEDDDISYTLMKRYLKVTGINILRALNGRECVEQVKSNPGICLVMMDIKMPEIDGYEATRLIRQINSLLPVVAQTAYALEGDRDLALSAGCNDYVSKPIAKETLLQIVDKYVYGVQ